MTKGVSHKLALAQARAPACVNHVLKPHLALVQELVAELPLAHAPADRRQVLAVVPVPQCHLSSELLLVALGAVVHHEVGE